MDIDKKLKELRVEIPELSKPAGYYQPAVRTGSLVYTSGQLPLVDNRLIFPGRVGKEVNTENAQKAAKAALVNALAAVKWLTHDLGKIKKIVRLSAQVCSAIGYTDHAKVANGASELLLQIFGDEIGAHSRVTVGCLELPMGACVELDLIVEVK